MSSPSQFARGIAKEGDDDLAAGQIWENGTMYLRTVRGVNSEIDHQRPSASLGQGIPGQMQQG